MLVFTCIPSASSFLHESLLNVLSHFLNEVCCVNYISYTELSLPSRDTSRFVIALVLFLWLWWKSTLTDNKQLMRQGFVLAYRTTGDTVHYGSEGFQ